MVEVIDRFGRRHRKYIDGGMDFFPSLSLSFSPSLCLSLSFILPHLDFTSSISFSPCLSFFLPLSHFPSVSLFSMNTGERYMDSLFHLTLHSHTHPSIFGLTRHHLHILKLIPPSFSLYPDSPPLFLRLCLPVLRLIPLSLPLHPQSSGLHAP